MKKLIKVDDLGNWGVKELAWKDLYPGQVITPYIHEKLYECLNRLKEYEETGLTPEEIEDLAKGN